MRIETDYLGPMPIPDDALYGIHSQRAKENFPDITPFHKEWYQAMGLVKQACYLTYVDFAKAVKNEPELSERLIDLIPDDILHAMISAAVEIQNGNYFEHFIVPAFQGGAGTSINMNVNEIIANVALLKVGRKPGDYQLIDPIEHANIYQSTNDVVPTALRVAATRL
ncbi:MAG TPA: lyase family protein, partial [Tenuifilaceae bacterium]|nr:lyase family protein [Tenuifilaceae bacterium]